MQFRQKSLNVGNGSKNKINVKFHEYPTGEIGRDRREGTEGW